MPAPPSETIQSHMPLISLSTRMLALVTALSALTLPHLCVAQAEAGSPVPPEASKPIANFSYSVASIKENKSGDSSVWLRAPGGELHVTNATVWFFLKYAYQLQDEQIYGAPNWLKSERFDIQAEADGTELTVLDRLNPRDQSHARHQMIQSLLANRFQLKVHEESKVLPVYELVIAKGGSKLGTAQASATQADGAYYMNLDSQPVSSLAGALTGRVGRIVVDKTGLTGRYDIKLRYDANLEADSPDVDGSSASTTGGTSLFTALREQLGLQLKSDKDSINVLVIDHIEQPSTN